MAATASASASARPSDPGPWWRHGFMWLVVGGPAVVVVASCITFWIAARSPDPVVVDEHIRRAARIQDQAERERSRVPASQARNHAATPAVAP